jgi:hypothetical protein
VIRVDPAVPSEKLEELLVRSRLFPVLVRRDVRRDVQGGLNGDLQGVLHEPLLTEVVLCPGGVRQRHELAHVGFDQREFLTRSASVTRPLSGADVF